MHFFVPWCVLTRFCYVHYGTQSLINPLLFHPSVSHMDSSRVQPSPSQPWSRRTDRNSAGWYRYLRRETRICSPVASVRWTSLWETSLFSLSTKGSSAMALCAWTKRWISPPRPRMVSWGEPPTLWRWASRSRQRTMTAYRRLLEESARNRKTIQVTSSREHFGVFMIAKLCERVCVSEECLWCAMCGPHIVDTCPFSVGRLVRSSGDVSECWIFKSCVAGRGRGYIQLNLRMRWCYEDQMRNRLCKSIKIKNV